MGDRKKLSYEFLKSEEIYGYFQELLDAQTKEILAQLNHQQNDYNNEKLMKVEEKCRQEMNKRVQIEKEKESLQVLLNRENERRLFMEKELEIERQKSEQLQLKCNRINEEMNSMEISQMKIVEQYEERVQQISSAMDNLQKLFQKYEGRYRSIDEAYDRYEEISPQIKNRLGNIFRTDSIYEFIVACSEWRNVEGVWHFIKRRIVEKELTDTDNLIFLFEFMIQAYNAQGNEKKYELITPNIGDRFDSDRHTIIGIKTDGFISEVRLSGIMSSDSGKVIQKALIEIQE